VILCFSVAKTQRKTKTPVYFLSQSVATDIVCLACYMTKIPWNYYPERKHQFFAWLNFYKQKDRKGNTMKHKTRVLHLPKLLFLGPLMSLWKTDPNSEEQSSVLPESMIGNSTWAQRKQAKSSGSLVSSWNSQWQRKTSATFERYYLTWQKRLCCCLNLWDPLKKQYPLTVLPVK
jgi:hypothetical protein